MDIKKFVFKDVLIAFQSITIIVGLVFVLFSKGQERGNLEQKVEFLINSQNEIKKSQIELGEKVDAVRSITDGIAFWIEHSDK